MNTSKTNKHFFRKFIILILALSLVLSIFLLAGCENKPNDPDKDEDDDTTTEEEVVDKGYIKNGTFEFLYDTSTTSTNYPRNPKNWSYSASGSGDDKAPSKDTDVTQGVMDFSDELYSANKDKFIDGEQPSKATASDTDTKLLMIHNKNATAGSFTSTSISLPENSYVVISAKILTSVGDKDKGAHISIIDGFEENVIVRNINTNKEWKEYKFYVETSAINSKTIKLQLGLGYGDRLNSYGHVEGCAYFDNVKLEFISKADYKKANTDIKEFSANGITENDIIVDYAKEPMNVKYSFRKQDSNTTLNTDIDFEDSLVNEKVNFFAGANSQVAIVNANDEAYKDTLKVKDKDGNFLPLPFNANESDLMLMLKNDVRATSSAWIDDVIAIEQNSYYKLSFYVKTSEMISGTGLNVNFYRIVDGKKDYTDLPTFKTIDTTKANVDLLDEANDKVKTQNWQLYSVVVAGNGFDTTKLGVEFRLGTNTLDNDITNGNANNDAKGSAFINDIVIEKISNDEYSNFATGSKQEKIALSTLRESGINNGNFNTPNSNNFNFNEELYNKLISAKDFSVLPQGHKNIGGNGEITVPHASTDFSAGIVNMNAYGGLISNGLAEAGTSIFDASTSWGNPNAFMIWNKQPTSIGLVSSEFSLALNKVYKISVRVKATNDAKYSIYLVDNKTNEIVKDENDNALKFENIGATTSTSFDDVLELGNGWSEYTFFVRTKDIAKYYRMEIWNGTRDDSNSLSTGTIFIDNIKLIDFNADSFEDNKATYTATDYVNKDRILFADYIKKDIVEEEDEDEDTTAGAEDEKKPHVFNWTLFSVATSSAILIIAFVVVLIVRMNKKGYFAKKKTKTTQNYNSEIVENEESNEESTEENIEE